MLKDAGSFSDLDLENWLEIINYIDGKTDPYGSKKDENKNVEKVGYMNWNNILK